MRRCNNCGHTWGPTNIFIPIARACSQCGSTNTSDEDDTFVPTGNENQKIMNDELMNWYNKIKLNIKKES